MADTTSPEMLARTPTPGGNPMNLSTINSAAAPGAGATAYCIVINLTGPATPPSGTWPTTIIAPDANVTYDITGKGPKGEDVDLKAITGDHVGVYSNP